MICKLFGAQIKKTEIALNAADARPSRWTGGEKVDVGIKDIQLDKRKVILKPSSQLISAFEEFFYEETRVLKNLFDERQQD